MTVPEIIREAVLRSKSSAPPTALAPPSGDPSEIAVAAPVGGEDGRRIVAVVSAQQETQTLTINLATEVVESATDFDLVLESGDGDLPFTLVLEAELYGPIFAEQLDGAIGRLDEKHRVAISRALVSDGESLTAFRTGLPFAGPNDPRREFKERELEDLERLVAKCRSWLAGEPVFDEILDPELVLPPPAGTSQDEAEDLYLELCDVINRMSTPALPSELLALMSEAELLIEISRWRTEFGLDTARILSLLGMTESPGGLPPLDVSHQTDVLPRASDVLLKPLLEIQARDGRHVVDIRTTVKRWRRQDQVIVAKASQKQFCRARPRIMEAA